MIITILFSKEVFIRLFADTKKIAGLLNVESRYL